MRNPLILVSMLALVGGCGASPSQKAPAPTTAAIPKPPAPVAASTPTNPSPTAAITPVTPTQTDPLAAKVALINQASFDAAAPTPTATPAAKTKDTTPDQSLLGPKIDPLILREEVLLARARFSPGVADGRPGTNLKHAIATYQTAHDMDATGVMDAHTWKALSAEPTSAPEPVRIYTITAADVAGPFADDVGEDFVKLAALPDGPQFTTPLEALAEQFHMSQALLTALNPDVDFTRAGERIVVVDDNPSAFTKGDVARVEVSKSDASAKAYDKTDKLIAFYPATVGSRERPSPSGVHKVVGVARHPTYTYDPAKLAWGPRSAGKLVVKPGPNNPVGTVWIDLNAPSYGIHGTPNPDEIGKTASHGCVRLTNWDAEGLAAGVKPGVVVTFIGQRAKHTRSAKRR